jgi:hypothetical protein
VTLPSLVDTVCVRLQPALSRAAAAAAKTQGRNFISK